MNNSYTERTEKALSFTEVLEIFMFAEDTMEQKMCVFAHTASHSSPCLSLHLRATPCSFPSVFLSQK